MSFSCCKDSIHSNGFAVLQNFAPGAVVEAILSELNFESALERAGTRQLHQRVSSVANFLQSELLKQLLGELLPDGFPVRSILFDKTPDTNWRVGWHQDLSICVKKRQHVQGFSAWSLKQQVQHVQPPASILERMLTLRLHLDDCDESNGPLLVIPQSHKHGRLSTDQIKNWRKKEPCAACTVPSGGAIIMKPLLLHSSARATNPKHRRVLHLEFAAEPLPQPLEWIS